MDRSVMDGSQKFSWIWSTPKGRSYDARAFEDRELRMRIENRDRTSLLRASNNDRPFSRLLGNGIGSMGKPKKYQMTKSKRRRTPEERRMEESAT
jgi:hypothetical protein